MLRASNSRVNDRFVLNANKSEVGPPKEAIPLGKDAWLKNLPSEANLCAKKLTNMAQQETVKTVGRTAAAVGDENQVYKCLL